MPADRAEVQQIVVSALAPIVQNVTALRIEVDALKERLSDVDPTELTAAVAAILDRVEALERALGAGALEQAHGDDAVTFGAQAASAGVFSPRPRALRRAGDDVDGPIVEDAEPGGFKRSAREVFGEMLTPPELRARRRVARG